MAAEDKSETPESPGPPTGRPRLGQIANRWAELERGRVLPGLSPDIEGFWLRSRFHRDPDADLRQRVEASGYLLYFIAAAQVALLALSLVAWWFVGAALHHAVVGVIAGLAIAAGLDALTRRALARGQHGTRGDTLWWLRVTGYAATFLVAMLVGSIVQTRIWDARAVNAVVALVVQLVFLQLSHWADRSAKEHGLPWPWIAFGLVLAPCLGGWAAASLPLGSDEHTVRRWLADQRGAAAMPRRCAAPLAGADEVRVAVALSGGGYRAAVTHAGLLAGLDSVCVPIHVLSSVSGGSIVGAAYALGVPPAEFASRLSRRKPGLPTAVVSIRAVMLDLWWPTGSIAETYREHFEATFFGSATLADLPETPLLLLNATDPETDVIDAREVFFRGRAPRLAVDGRPLDRSVRVADAVAASGAFPGAFRAKSIRWPASDDTTRGAMLVKDRKFLDGGIIDNLGVEGLRRYLTIRNVDQRLPARPHVLIISDASGYGSPAGLEPKADAVTLLQRGTDYSYEALHRHLYARYTGQDNVFGWMQSRPVAEHVGVVPYAQLDSRLRGGAPEALVTVAIPMTASVMADVLARHPGCRGEGGEDARVIQRRVRAFSTLYELDQREVRDAFWLGFAAASVYRPAIACALARAAGRACPVAPAGAPEAVQEVRCPSLAAVLAGRTGP